MQIDSLLEKRERAIYQLLLFLENRKDAPLLKDVSHYLALSKSTLLHYIKSFNQESAAVELGLVFHLEEEKLSLQKDARLSQEQILSYLFQPSIKYQIIVFLLDKADVSLQMLSQELLISEATLNRHLASLNQLLAEFGIAVKNGRLKGSELQIRYFLHQILLLTTVSSKYQAEFARRHLDALLPLFERFYQSKLNPKQTHRLLLWLMISQQRSKLQQLDYKALYSLMEPYQNHKFYRRLRKIYLTVGQQQSASFQEGEIMALFAFLFSHFILEPHQLEQALGFGGPIMEATSLALRVFRSQLGESLSITEESLYHLNQTMSQFYFFQSSLELERVQDISFAEEADQLLKKVFKKVFHRSLDTNQLMASYYPKILVLYLYFSQVEPIRVKVGFASSLHEMVSYLLLMQLREKLEGNRQVLVVPYQNGKAYDFIITDYLEESPCPIYYLGTQLKMYDLLQLKSTIQELYHQKIRQSEKMATQTPFSIEHR